MSVFYNEIDPYAAQWLRNLIAAGHIAPGVVDERSIVDLDPDELRGYVQCHFFAGIGGWSHALRLSGWADARPVWTGSCPCQAHSSAARGRHVERDWWPAWWRLIAAVKPCTVFGEQVADARRWIDGIGYDLEDLGYAFGSAVLPACSVGADHARARLWFVGHADSESKPGCAVDGEVARLPRLDREPGGVVPPNGLPDRVACLRAFGNAIVPQVAAEFIRAVA